MEENKEKQISPSEYFDYLKGAKQTITTEALKNSFAIFIKLAEKYNKTGQNESMKKLCFLADTLIKEEKLIEMGVTTYIYKDTIEDYIENVADSTVKIIELSRYTREVPDAAVEVVEKTKGLFDEFYVVFTDYTGKEERKVMKERRDKDPILFGVFKNNANVADRFYFLCDWVDEYCDLTLDKMIQEYKDEKGYSPAITTNIPSTSEELVGRLKLYTIDDTVKETSLVGTTDTKLTVKHYVASNKENIGKSFFQKVRSIFKHFA